MPEPVPPRAAGGGQASTPDDKNDRKHKDYEPSEDERLAVELWLGRVRRAETRDDRKQWFDQLQDLRDYANGTKHKDANASVLTRTNLVFATMAAMMPHLYAKNPDIAITPSAACPKERLPLIKLFCRGAEAVLGQMFVKEAKLKKRAKSNLRSVMTTSYGVVKMLYQKDYRGDPIIVRRVQDAQDNIAKIEADAADLKEGTDIVELARQRDDMKAQLQGLVSGNEVKLYKGFVIDRLRSEDFLVLDDSIAEFDEYVDAAALAHLVWMTVGTYKAQFGCEPHGATKYNQAYAKTENQTAPEGQKPDDMFVCAVEIWDKGAGVVRTVCKGANRWARLPYAPQCTPQRWYPFYALGFNLVEGRWRPISDVELLKNLQEEYNTTRTNFADVRKDSVPVRVFRKAGGLTEEDIKALSETRRNRDWIGIEGNPQIPLAQDIMQLEGPKIDPQAYDVSLIRNDMDVVVGLSDAGRANLIKPKTATEAEIMNQALGLRVGERRDANEDMMAEMAEAALEIAMRDMTKDEVAKIAGVDAAKAWPADLSVDEIFALVDVTVKAGSSGRPDQAKEREQWTQLLPVVKETMESVAELRSQGQNDMANAAIELLRETLRRFQERLDIDALIPPLDQEGAQAGAAAELAKLRPQAAQLEQALSECKAELQKAQAGEASKAAKATADGEAKKEEIASRERIAAADGERRAATEQHIALVRAASELLAQQMTERRGEAAAAGEEKKEAKQALSMETMVETLRETLQALNDTVKRLGAAGSAGSPAAG